MMDTEIDNMSQIVQELLQLSKIRSGKVPLNKTIISVDELILPAVERMRLQAVRAGLTLNADVPTGLPMLSADVERMGQVLVNLIHNAVKFTPPGGKITISAERRENDMVISIQDTGVGIADQDLPRIFERFYKADRARSGGGTGLGLSIARHIIEAHGGRIWAESLINEGSTFYFSLPIVPSLQ